MRQKTIQHGSFLILLGLVTFAFFDLIRDFFQPVFWAAVLAVLFRPVKHHWEEVFRGRESLACVTTILTIILSVLVPLLLIGTMVTREAVSMYELMTAGDLDITAPITIVESALPMLTEFLGSLGIDPVQIREGVQGFALAVSQFVANKALAVGQDALRITVLSFLMLYILYFFLRDGDQIVDAIVRALPLGDDRERRLFSRFAQVARATIKGTFVIGIIQGTLGGLLFWILGIRAPVLWGVVMTFFSLLPAVGAAVVWGPAAIVLILMGSYIKGIILLVLGTVVISLVDNILRPILVGRDTRMPDFLVLLSTLGGLAIFGISGFILGPVIAALFLTVWGMFAEEYAEEQRPEEVREAAVHPEEVEEGAPPGTVRSEA